MKIDVAQVIRSLEVDGDDDLRNVQLAATALRLLAAEVAAWREREGGHGGAFERLVKCPCCAAVNATDVALTLPGQRP
jgi:hypothetical protein